MLSQIYFLISGIRTPDTSLLSQPFQLIVRIVRCFAVESAHLTKRQAWRFHTWSADAGLGPFKSQGWGVCNRFEL